MFICAPDGSIRAPHPSNALEELGLAQMHWLAYGLPVLYFDGP